ncbi:MAG: hypothetical protein ACP5N1_05575 [Candidatus Woesearchaeota archaeon]
MAIDVLTVILTAVCTGIGISIGNALYEVYFKDPIKKLKKQNDRLKKLHKKLLIYKRPWLAALLNIFLWGMGYFYIKRKRFLGSLLLIIQVFVIGGFAFGQGDWKNIFEGMSYSFLTIIISISLGIDAYRLARDVNSGKE